MPTLATEVRRELVSLLSAQGMSPKSIAPVVGTTRRRVSQIRAEVETQGGNGFHPEPTDQSSHTAWPPVAKPDPAAMPARSASTMAVNSATPGPSATVPIAPAPSPAAVTGLDGKTRETSRPGLRVAVPGRSTLAVPDRPPDPLPGGVGPRGGRSGVLVEVEQTGAEPCLLGCGFVALERDVARLDAGRPCRKLGVLEAQFRQQLRVTFRTR